MFFAMIYQLTIALLNWCTVASPSGKGNYQHANTKFIPILPYDTNPYYSQRNSSPPARERRQENCVLLFDCLPRERHQPRI